MGVAGRLDADAGGGRAREVVRHDEGRAAEERERGLRHALVAYGKEVLHAVALLLAQQRHRALAAVLHLPGGMARAWHLLAQRLAVLLRLVPLDVLLGDELLLQQAAQPPMAYSLAHRGSQEALMQRVRDRARQHPSAVHSTLLAESSDPW